MLALTNCYCANDKVNEYVDKARDAWQDGDVDGAIDALASATVVTKYGENSNVCFALAELHYVKFTKEACVIDAGTHNLIQMFLKCYRDAYMFKDQ